MRARETHPLRSSCVLITCCAIALVLCTSASPVLAGMCGTPTVRLYPWAAKTVPANAQLLVRLHDPRDIETRFVRGAVADHHQYDLVSERGVHIGLRRVEPPGEINPQRGVSFTWLALAVSELLVDGEKYALFVDNEKLAWLAPMIAGPALAEVAPTFTVRSARFVDKRPSGNNKGNVYGARIVVALGETSVPSAQLVFTVTPLDLTAAPPIWRDVDKGAFEFGAIGECMYRDLELAGHGRQRFDLRAVDLAGHVSAPVTITVETGALKRTRPASKCLQH